MLKIRFHGRGGQGVKTSSHILGRAAFIEGFMAQDSPVYGAERRGAPVVAFTRISNSPILERGFIFDPDIVVVMDETLLDDWLARPLEGLKRGGVLFINTSPDAADERFRAGNVVKYSLTDAALTIVGKPVISSAAAAAAAKMTGFVKRKSVLEATVAELSELGLKDDVLERNLRLVGEVYDAVPRPVINVEPETIRREVVTLSSRHVLSLDILSLGNSTLRRTGNWRLYKPVVDYQKCTGCMVCYIYCPESAIVLDSAGKPLIDYENCKGCLVCLKECPLKAIEAVREVKVYA
ncbi:MAG: 2-oxoacid:acceptor oxidoreductase family protein [Candidatus Caldarchaeum sp.]